MYNHNKAQQSKNRVHISWDILYILNPDSKVHGANMGPIRGPQAPGGLHVGPRNFSIWEALIGNYSNKSD